MWLITHPAIFALLIGWGVTSAYQWKSNYEDKLQWQQATQAYETAYMDSREQYDQLDIATKKAALQRRDIHGKANTALEGLNSVARQEVKKKMGGACGPYAAGVGPHYYVDILRLAAQQTPNRNEAKKQSSTQRITARLRAALAIESNADRSGVREEPSD